MVEKKRIKQIFCDRKKSYEIQVFMSPYKVSLDQNYAYCLCIIYGCRFTWASLVAQLVKNPPAMQETWVRSLGWEDPLEKGKAPHSSILAWRIPWTVQSTGSQRVRHNWASFTFTDIIISFIGNNAYCNIKQKARHYSLWFCFAFEIEFYQKKNNNKVKYSIQESTITWNGL